MKFKNGDEIIVKSGWVRECAGFAVRGVVINDETQTSLKIKLYDDIKIYGDTVFVVNDEIKLRKLTKLEKALK